MKSPIQHENPWWRAWLPSLQQISNGTQLRFELYRGSEQESLAISGNPIAVSMRQAMGLICLMALLAGLLPFLFNWFIAARAGTALPLSQLARAVRGDETLMSPGMLGSMAALRETAQTIAGLEPTRLPGWLAAGLSALGAWLSMPLQWLSVWLVYGLGVLVVLKLLGATTTLQHFYAATGYAAVPLLLMALGPIPCLGPLVSLAAVFWAFLVYVQAARAVTTLDTGRVVIAVLAPGALGVLLGLLALAAVVAGLMRFVL